MKTKRSFGIIECQGTPYEMGQQYGNAGRDNIHKSVEDFFGGIIRMQKASREEILVNARKYLLPLQQFDPDGIEFMKGQAEGAGVTFDEVLALKCRFELGIYFRYITCLCTSFAATGEATSGGQTIIGQNFDLTAGMTMDLLKLKPKNGIEQLSLIFGGGCELVLNSSGLGMALNVMMSPADEQSICVPCCSIITKAMRQKRIGDALGIVCASGRSILNYLFASSEGDIVGIETRPGDFNVNQPEKDMLVHTNHYLTDRFKRGDGTFGLMEGDSYIRVHRIKRLMEKYYGRLTPQLMMDILSDHHNYPNSICAHMNPDMPRGETLSSVVMVPAEKVMYVSRGQPCKYEFEAYSL